MIRKWMALLLPVLLFSGFFSGRTPGETEAETIPAFGELAGLDAFQERLDQGEEFQKVSYRNQGDGEAYGFETKDPEVIGQIWEALLQVEVQEKTDLFVTDSDQILQFTLGEENLSLRFNHYMLETEDATYVLKEDREFWQLLGILSTPLYGDGPAETEPAETEPAETEPAETEPAETEPVETLPAETDPTETDPAETEPAPAEYYPNVVDLYFPTIPSTGYSWSFEVADPEILEVTGEVMTFASDSQEAGLVGGKQTQWYHLKGLKEGMTSVVFRYFRPWETEEKAAYDFTYRVQINDKGDVLIWGVEMK